MHKIGFMQGRLTPSLGRGIQFFPFDNWKKEFHLAKKIGLTSVCFIFDLERYEENPLWTPEGRKEINALLEETGVKINFICADFFMHHTLFEKDAVLLKENIEILKKLLGFAKEVDALGIEIPCLDSSSIKTEEEEDILLSSIKEALKSGSELPISLETDYTPEKYVRLIKKIKDESLPIKITYDSGNSSGRGYDPKEEIETYGEEITNVHIKDRLKGDATKTLGEGSADFETVFTKLKEKNYSGDFILQVARGEDFKEEKTVASQIKFVKKYIKKYFNN